MVIYDSRILDSCASGHISNTRRFRTLSALVVLKFRSLAVVNILKYYILLLVVLVAVVIVVIVAVVVA
jgi:hypothetical protein